MISPAQREIERLRAEITAIMQDPVAMAQMDRAAYALAEQIRAAEGLSSHHYGIDSGA